MPLNRRNAWRIAAAAAAVISFDACADMGIGLLMMWIPPAIVALLPAILVEGPVLSRFLHVPGRRGLWLSFVANIASTMAGIVVAIAASLVIPGGAQMARELTLVALVPMFFFTWWLERWVVASMVEPATKPLAKKATLVANAITYAAMAIGAWLLLPPNYAVFDRFRLAGPLMELGLAKVEVAKYFDEHQHTFPPPKSFPTTNVNVRSIVSDADGRLVLTLSFPASKIADGKTIVVEPVVDKGVIKEWRCYSRDLEAKHLPASCR